MDDQHQPGRGGLTLSATGGELPRPSRADVEAIAGAVDDDEWAGCEAIIEREAAHGIEVTDRYLAWAVEEARRGG